MFLKKDSVEHQNIGIERMCKRRVLDSVTREEDIQ